MRTLTPAYGRGYRTRDEAVAAYLGGKDFVLHDVSSKWNGSYCSVRDFPNEAVKLRYNRLRNATVVDSK